MLQKTIKICFELKNVNVKKVRLVKKNHYLDQKV
jgi:hypothetical protein